MYFISSATPVRHRSDASIWVGLCRVNTNANTGTGDDHIGHTLGGQAGLLATTMLSVMIHECYKIGSAWRLFHWNQPMLLSLRGSAQSTPENSLPHKSVWPDVRPTPLDVPVIKTSLGIDTPCTFWGLKLPALFKAPACLSHARAIA